MRRGPVFREALDVEVPAKWSEWAFEYRIGYDAGMRFKKYFPSPTMSPERRDAFRAGWNAARSAKLFGVAVPGTTEDGR